MNGRLDIVNLFPVKLDLKPFEDAWGNGARFVLWSPAGNALRFCGLSAQLQCTVFCGKSLSCWRRRGGVARMSRGELAAVGEIPPAARGNDRGTAG